MPNGFMTKRPDPQRAKQEKVTGGARSSSTSGADRMFGPSKDQSDNTIGPETGGGGYVGSVPLIERDDHARHPLGKQWTTKSRGVIDTMHTD